MSILQKIIRKIIFFASSKKGIQTTQFTAAFIFVAAISFVIGNIFSTHSHEQNIQQNLSNNPFYSSANSRKKNHFFEQNKNHLLSTQEKSNKSSALSKLFSEQNLNSRLIPSTNQEPTAAQTKPLESAFLKSDLQIFGFNANSQTTNPINALSDLIQELYSIDAPLLNIAQEINASIFQTFEQMAIKNQDILFSENAARLSQKGEPYPFMVLELSKNGSELPYFPSQKERRKFISVLSDNIVSRTLPQNFASKNQSTYIKLDPNIKVKVVDEEHFIYITFNNIISHVIRLEPRKEKMSRINPLKNKDFYFTLIIDDVGENFSIARKMMDLPFPVILSIWPQSTHGTSIAVLAHEKGLPVFLHQPMEPMPDGNYIPRMGLGGLKVGMSQEEITRILQKNILAVPHLRGINNHMGSKFTTNPKAVNTFLLALKDIMPHVLIVDSITHNKSLLHASSKQYGFLTGQRNYFIDNPDSNIYKELDNAYRFAKKNGHVYVIGHARQKTLRTLLAWDKYKDENIVFTLPSY